MTRFCHPSKSRTIDSSSSTVAWNWSIASCYPCWWYTLTQPSDQDLRSRTRRMEFHACLFVPSIADIVVSLLRIRECLWSHTTCRADSPSANPPYLSAAQRLPADSISVRADIVGESHRHVKEGTYRHIISPPSPPSDPAQTLRTSGPHVLVSVGRPFSTVLVGWVAG